MTNNWEEKERTDASQVKDRIIADEEKSLKTSFDRFGDDLSELIVSYLTIEDKFRFQCLSKQWRRLVFNKTYVLKISMNNKLFVEKSGYDYKLKTKSFEKCLQKLWALVDIDIDFNVITDGEVLRIIAENCHHLRRLSIDLSLKQLLT